MKKLYKSGFALIPIVVIVLVILAGGWFYIASNQMGPQGPRFSPAEELIDMGPKEVYLKSIDDAQYIKNKTDYKDFITKYATKEAIEFIMIFVEDKTKTEEKFMEDIKKNTSTRDQILSIIVGEESKHPKTGEKMVNLTIKTSLPGDNANKKQEMVWRDGRWQFGLGF